MDDYLVFCFEFSIRKHSVKRKTCKICTAALQNMERQNYTFHARTLYFYRRHLGETNLRTTALDLRSEDHESKTYKPLVENHYCHPSSRRFIDSFTNWGLTKKLSHQDGRRKCLNFKNETKRSPIQFFFLISGAAKTAITNFILPFITRLQVNLLWFHL